MQVVMKLSKVIHVKSTAGVFAECQIKNLFLFAERKKTKVVYKEFHYINYSTGALTILTREDKIEIVPTSQLRYHNVLVSGLPYDR